MKWSLNLIHQSTINLPSPQVKKIPSGSLESLRSSFLQPHHVRLQRYCEQFKATERGEALKLFRHLCCYFEGPKPNSEPEERQWPNSGQVEKRSSTEREREQDLIKTGPVDHNSTELGRYLWKQDIFGYTTDDIVECLLVGSESWHWFGLCFGTVEPRLVCWKDINYTIRKI